MNTSLRGTQLREYEKVIERGQKTFVEVGVALAKIREGKLFREDGYTTFADYCEGRWSMGRSYAYRLIQGARDYELSPTGDKPSTERQARARRAEISEEVTNGYSNEAAADAERQERREGGTKEACCHCPIHCP